MAEYVDRPTNVCHKHKGASLKHGELYAEVRETLENGQAIVKNLTRGEVTSVYSYFHRTSEYRLRQWRESEERVLLWLVPKEATDETARDAAVDSDGGDTKHGTADV